VPHRGNLLLLLGRVALVCGLLSVCLAVPAVIGLPLGLGVWVVGQRDLKRMAAGAMDPGGRTDVMRATDLGIGGAFLSLFFGSVIIAALLTTLLGRR
jgi:hypothetical protein